MIGRFVRDVTVTPPTPPPTRPDGAGRFAGTPWLSARARLGKCRQQGPFAMHSTRPNMPGRAPGKPGANLRGTAARSRDREWLRLPAHKHTCTQRTQFEVRMIRTFALSETPAYPPYASRRSGRRQEQLSRATDGQLCAARDSQANNQTAAPNGGYLRTGHGSGPTTERDRTSGLHAARIADSERLAGRLVELRRASVSASSGCPRAGR